jgi:hypothetical protein
VISIFYKTKIPTVDMKVQVYSKFSKNNILKKVKSPISMRNGAFNTSKCKGKLQKMGVLYTHSLKSPGPFSKLPQKKNEKKGTEPTGPGVDLQSPAGCGSIPGPASSVSFFFKFFSSCPPFFVHVVNSGWLAPAHARPA